MSGGLRVEGYERKVETKRLHTGRVQIGSENKKGGLAEAHHLDTPHIVLRGLPREINLCK